MSSGSNDKGRRLGRGLSALLNDTPPVAIDVPRTAPTNGSGGPSAASRENAPTHSAPTPAAKFDPSLDNPAGRFTMIPTNALRANPWQPRRSFDDASIKALADSMRVAGMMQPIVVRRVPKVDGCEIIAGERRWRAAALLGLQTVPAIIANLSDQEAAEWALVENLQREDLNPMDRARGLQRLCEQFGLTHKELGARTGLDRSTVANMMRLAELEPPIILHVENSKLSIGHAKVLLSMIAGQPRIDIAEQAVRGGWSVRRLENAIATALTQRARGAAAGQTPAAQSVAAQAAHEAQANLRSLERDIAETLGAKVRLHTDRSGKKGRVVIHFYDLDQFDGLLQRFGVKVM